MRLHRNTAQTKKESGNGPVLGPAPITAACSHSARRHAPLMTAASWRACYTLLYLEASVLTVTRPVSASRGF